jgi:myo-inositol-1(or 4)-monophosphatase
MTGDELDERLTFASDLSRTAGAFALGHFANLSALHIQSKGVQDMATEADMDTETMIHAALSEHYPEDNFLGEETYTDFTPETGRGTWVVDPIDGTQPFICGIPSWCIAIAYVANGQILVGVVYDPTHDELYTARLGGGTYLNGAPCRASDISSLADGLTGIGYSTRVPVAATLEPMARLLAADGMFHRCGSGALSLAYVAAGRLAGYFEPHMNSWDAIAGLLLVSEAGGKSCDFMSFSNALRDGGEIMAAGSNLYAELEHVVRS